MKMSDEIDNNNTAIPYPPNEIISSNPDEHVKRNPKPTPKSKRKAPRPPKAQESPQPPRPKKLNSSLIISLTGEFAPFEYEQSQIIAKQIDDYMGKNIEFEILSSVRFDPTISVNDNATEFVRPENFFLLKEHWQRLQFSTDFFGWDVDIPYDHLVKELISTISSLNPMLPYKVRVLVKKDNVLRIEAYPVSPRLDLFSGINNFPIPLADDPVYKVYLDTEMTMVSPFTSFKTTYRDHYNQSRKRMLKNNGDLEEVLVFNSCDEIMEGSISNVAFRRDDKWVTPMISTGCLCGVVRHVLLLAGQIQEGNILKNSVIIGEPVLIFNGVVGVCAGVIAKP